MLELALCPEYRNIFDPITYLETYYSQDSFLLEFVLRSLHEVFENGRVRGHTLLDIGTGPTIHSIISACPYVKDIYSSDLCEQNRTLLKDWKEGKSERGSDICDVILSMENGKKQTSMNRFKDMRNKVKGILPIDVRDQPMFGEETVAPDIIVSSFCLEATCESYENYEQVVKRVGSLLPKGGHLVLVGVLQEIYYMIGSTKFPCLYLEKTDVHAALNAAGFRTEFWRELEDVETDLCDCKSVFVSHSIKY